jgi:mRNA interferase MazF
VKRGELYRVYKPNKRDPKQFRTFVVIGRQVSIDSDFSTVTCVPIYSNCSELETQVDVGIEEGLKHESCIYCDELVSLPKSALTNFVGSLSKQKVRELNTALKIALELED